VLSFFVQSFTFICAWLPFQTKEALFAAVRITLCYAWPTSPFNYDTSLYLGCRMIHGALLLLGLGNGSI